MLQRFRQIRALTETEIEELQRALGRRVESDYLAHWVSEAINDTVRSIRFPTSRQLRDGLRDIEHRGRQLLSRIDDPKVVWFLRERTALAKFRTAAAQFCEDTAALVRDLDVQVKPGRSRTPAVLEAFVDRMIGIAKRAKVPPSTPSRRMGRKTAATPAFFNFLRIALRIGRQVIETSKLPDDVKKAAVAKLQFQTRDALVKVVVKARGKIGKYRETPFGLVETNLIDPAGQ